jgi:hypothetical protein
MAEGIQQWEYGNTMAMGAMDTNTRGQGSDRARPHGPMFGNNTQAKHYVSDELGDRTRRFQNPEVLGPSEAGMGFSLGIRAGSVNNKRDLRQREVCTCARVPRAFVAGAAGPRRCHSSTSAAPFTDHRLPPPRRSNQNYPLWTLPRSTRDLTTTKV